MDINCELFCIQPNQMLMIIAKEILRYFNLNQS